MDKITCTYYKSCFQNGVHFGDIHISSESSSLNKKEVKTVQKILSHMVNLLSPDQLLSYCSYFLENPQTSNHQFLKNKLHQYIFSLKNNYDLIEFSGDLIQTLGEKESFNHSDQCGDYNYSSKLSITNLK